MKTRTEGDLPSNLFFQAFPSANNTVSLLDSYSLCGTKINHSKSSIKLI